MEVVYDTNINQKPRDILLEDTWEKEKLRKSFVSQTIPYAPDRYCEEMQFLQEMWKDQKVAKKTIQNIEKWLAFMNLTVAENVYIVLTKLCIR